MLTSKLIREAINKLVARMKAVLKIAEDDNRESAPDEIAEMDAILAELGEQGDKPTGLYAKLKRAERIEKEIENQLVPPAIVDPTNARRPITNFGHVPGALRGYRQTNEGREAAYRAGRFLAAVIYGRQDSVQWCQDYGMPLVQNAMSTESNTLGGFLVPTEFSQAIIDLRETYGVFRQNVRVSPMAGDVLNVPKRLAGVTAYAVGDNDEITASDKTWTNVELVAKKWGALVKYSSELAEDAFISLADDLANEIAYAFALKEDQCGFTGDGTSTYHGTVGVVNKANDGSHAGTLYTALTGNTAFSTLDIGDFEGMMGQLPQYAAFNARWYISRVGYYASMARLLDAGGGNTITELANGSRVPMFLGYPVVFSQVMNATTGTQTSTAGLALFGDLNLSSAMGERRGFEVAVSTDRYFELDQIGIRGTERIAINNHSLGDASTAGPVIVLKTPSS